MPRTLVRMTCSALFAAALLPVGSAAATTFCVGSADELAAALKTASTNQQDDTVLLRQGGHTLWMPGGLQFVAADGKGLVLDGGWLPFFGNPCGIRYNGPALTRLDGYGSARILTLVPSGNSDVVVRNISFEYGSSWQISPNVGGGVLVDKWLGHTGTVVLENNRFANNSSEYGAALVLRRDAGTMIVRNNVFEGNVATKGSAALFALVESGAYAALVNNSFVGNHISTPSASARVIGLSGSGHVAMGNNLIWGNTDVGGGGVDLVALPGTVLLTNNIELLGGTPAASSSGNLAVAPKFVDAAAGNFRLAHDSPLRNRGTNLNTDLVGTWDNDGSTRRMGRSIDIGAFESVDAFADGFE